MLGCLQGKELKLLCANYDWFEVNQLLFADGTALVADSTEKLSILMSEFIRVSDSRKSRVNVGKSKVMRCSRYVTVGRIDVRINANR